MKIFISWSGQKSLQIAKLIKEFLEVNLQATEPWISKDIEKGRRWSAEIANSLEESNFGIICLTQDNLDSPWILFESGALSKLQDGCLYTLLSGIEHNEVKQPLAQFQHTLFNKIDFKNMLTSINTRLNELDKRSLSAETLDKIYEKNFDELHEQVQKILSEENQEVHQARSTDDKIDEILNLVRSSNIGDVVTTPGKFFMSGKDGRLYETVYPGISNSVTPDLYRRIQAALNERGYDIAVDGQVGTKTKDALIRFQKENNLPVGALDVETLRALGVK
jgi:hypothetical protein